MKSADTLESNFDKMLLGLMSEVHSWQRFQGEYPIPYAAHDRDAARGGSAQIARKHYARRVRLQSDFDAAGA